MLILRSQLDMSVFFAFTERIETVKLMAWERDTQVKHVQLECMCMCMCMLGWRHREG